MKLSAIAAFLETDIQTEIPALKKVLRASGASSLEHVLQVVQQLNGEYPAAVLVFGPADQKIENDMMLENQGTLLVVGTFSVAVAESEEGLWDILDAVRG